MQGLWTTHRKKINLNAPPTPTPPSPAPSSSSTPPLTASSNPLPGPSSSGNDAQNMTMAGEGIASTSALNSNDSRPPNSTGKRKSRTGRSDDKDTKRSRTTTSSSNGVASSSYNPNSKHATEIAAAYTPPFHPSLRPRRSLPRHRKNARARRDAALASGNLFVDGRAAAEGGVVAWSAGVWEDYVGEGYWGGGVGSSFSLPVFLFSITLFNFRSVCLFAFGFGFLERPWYGVRMNRGTDG